MPVMTRRHARPRTVLATAAAVLVVATAVVQAAPPAPAKKAPPPAAANVLWDHYIVRSPATGKVERFWVGRPKRLKADGVYPAIYFLDGLLGDEHEWKRALDPLLDPYDLVAVCPSVGGVIS